MASWLRLREPIDTPTAIGIAVVIGANFLISLALNIQKLAHRRLDIQPSPAASRKSSATPPASSSSGRPLRPRPRAGSNASYGGEQARYLPSTAVILETEPLLQRPPLRKALSGLPTVGGNSTDIGDRKQHVAQGVAAILPRRSSSLHSGSRKLVPKAKLAPKSPVSPPVDGEVTALLATDIPIVGEPSSPSQSRPQSRAEQQPQEGRDKESGNESDYLKSKLWWLGFALMNLGEFGNFLSYAYAPASVVAPLGASALIANCFFAPLILHEKFRKRDILGIGLAILGAVTVVSAAKTSDLRLDPEALLEAIQQRMFVIYSGICVAVVIPLVWLSGRGAGEEWIGVDIGICALFGGFTVLSTKAISTLVSMLGFQMFKYWITYPTALVLIGTGVGQIKYLNRALMRFDSKAVIPTQFVGFNLSAIVGSAILYRDFENVTFHQMLSFVNGIGMTFLGVWILATRASVVTLDEEDDDGGRDHPGDVEAGFGRGEVPIVPVSAIPITLRKKSSTTALGISPGQQLLIAAEGVRIRAHSQEPGHGSFSARRRTIAFAG
ncbi:DUF803-domain-containing protein [Exidia glandulosa HHB12029]|uniref:DUF803-domain-containing protein n=1 Tax=Exidia glandulosa HHB12029 TaxID=1314781 RepID=A0A165QT88_EXIGL|nr:DUF803-domain-containing protein [Exidia glandulosa HHB12029]